MNNFSDRSVNREGTSSIKWDKYKGRNVLPFWLADMDFACPPAVVEAVRRRSMHEVYGYTFPTEELYDAVLSYLRNKKGLCGARKEWIVWLPGVVPGLSASCRAFTSPGEKVIVQTPVYSHFMHAASTQGRVECRVPLKRTGMDYDIDWAGMENAAREGARLLLLCNPHNPVGKVFTKGELEELVDFCSSHGIIICSDDIHCDLIISEEVEHTPILGLKGAENMSLMLMAPSKTYNIPGLSCAYAVIADEALRRRFVASLECVAGWVNLFGYEACRAAYQDSESWLDGLMDYLRSNRAFLINYVRERMPEIKIGSCEATYMAWLDASELGQDNPAAFFEEAGVGLSDGAEFGEAQMLRLNYACPRKMLEEGLSRMEQAVRRLREPLGPKSILMG